MQNVYWIRWFLRRGADGFEVNDHDTGGQHDALSRCLAAHFYLRRQRL
jgi:hypothetical protein